MISLQPILQQLFRKESLEEVSLEQLEQVTKEHPLFAPAHFLLAMKYKDTGNDLFEKQIQRTALHFHNPLWLHYHLSAQPSSENSSQHALHETPVIKEPANLEPVAPTHDLLEEVVVHQEITEPVTTPESTTTSPESVAANETRDDNTILSDDAHIGEVYTTNQESEAWKLAESNTAAAASGDEDNRQLAAEQPEAVPTDDQEVKPADTHPLFRKLKDEDNEESKVTFEPLYTVDYFASQGIRVTQELKPEDRLGKQLKSFTEWLRTMRKLPEATVEAELEKINDREIENIAAHSLDANEVVTEAMAEVLAKQGRQEQAAQVYRKLSLLNPGKSAYFAAKIDDLKNH